MLAFGRCPPHLLRTCSGVYFINVPVVEVRTPKEGRPFGRCPPRNLPVFVLLLLLLLQYECHMLLLRFLQVPLCGSANFLSRHQGFGGCRPEGTSSLLQQHHCSIISTRSNTIGVALCLQNDPVDVCCHLSVITWGIWLPPSRPSRRKGTFGSTCDVGPRLHLLPRCRLLNYDSSGEPRRDDCERFFLAIHVNSYWLTAILEHRSYSFYREMLTSRAGAHRMKAVYTVMYLL